MLSACTLHSMHVEAEVLRGLARHFSEFGLDPKGNGVPEKSLKV